MTKIIRLDDSSMAEVRSLFDAVIDFDESAAQYVASNSSIVMDLYLRFRSRKYKTLI